MNAFATHILLLISFHHDLRGLKPERFQTLAAVIGLSCLVAAVRWGVDGGVPHGLAVAGVHGMLLLLLAHWSPRFCVAVALASIGVDLMWAILHGIGLSWASDGTQCWELALTGFYGYRALRFKAAA